jgi:AraC-like DNA-binding protein
MEPRRAHDYEDVPRPVVGIGNAFPASFELAEHHHRRGQFLYAASGVVAVGTPEGAWVAPPERGVWIPAGMPHSVRMVGSVQTRSVLIEPAACTGFPPSCRIVAVSGLLRQLLVTASEIPPEYDEDGRDGMVMRLLVAEIGAAPMIPLAVPFPHDAALAALCHAYLERPNATVAIDRWAEKLSMNRRTFTRLFRRETGMSFAEWRQQACIAVALPRLAAGDPITAIALDLGYDGPANFSTMFKRALGAPPSRYRPSLSEPLEVLA